MIASTRIHFRAVYYSQQHGGDAGEEGISWIELADGGRILAADRTAVTEICQVAAWRPATSECSTGNGRHLLRASHGLSVEGVATRVWERQHSASLLPGVDTTGRVWQGVAANATAVRPPASYRLELAECRWLHDQGATGRGKKPGKTRPIAVSWGSNGRFFLTAAACRLVWRSAAPTPTTRNFSSKRSTASRCLARSDRRVGNICVATWATTAKSFGSDFAAAATCRISSREGKNAPKNERGASAPVAGLSSASRRGSIATAASSCGGKRKPTTIKRCCILFSPTSCGAIPRVVG